MSGMSCLQFNQQHFVSVIMSIIKYTVVGCIIGPYIYWIRILILVLYYSIYVSAHSSHLTSYMFIPFILYCINVHTLLYRYLLSIIHILAYKLQAMVKMLS